MRTPLLRLDELGDKRFLSLWHIRHARYLQLNRPAPARQVPLFPDSIALAAQFFPRRLARIFLAFQLLAHFGFQRRLQ